MIPKPTLGQVFAASLAALTAFLALLFYVVFAGSRASILESSERLREEASREIGGRVTRFLSVAPEAVREFQSELSNGLLDAHEPFAVETALFALLLSHPEAGEITLTYSEQTGFSEKGAIQLAITPRGQLSVVRSVDERGRERFWSRHIFQEHGAFAATRRGIAASAHFSTLPLTRETAAPNDPTAHATFITPAQRNFSGQLLWSDLHRSQLDAELPEAQRRVEVSVQQTVHDAAGKFAGVLRVGLLTQQLDTAVQQKLSPEGNSDPHRIFLCDAEGRLISRLTPKDRLQEIGDDLRIAPDGLPAPIVRALADPKLRAVNEETPVASGHFQIAGREFLTTFRALPGTQDWIVGIVVPRAYYLGKLTAMRDRLLLIFLGVIVLLLAGGWLILHGLKRAQARIVGESLKMNAFEFSPAPTASPFRDVSEILESLEKAKTAMRAMGKYVPIDLVRRLYREKSEPVLGGEPVEISILFSDIKNFTTFSEQLAPNILAAALGRYLDAMAHIIQQETHGTIDKYIGDAIMTIWNAPEPVAEHARMACLAALRCREAGRALAQSPEWSGLPPFETRFGLHRDTALVGHFGAHDRMNYTAIGDAINLCSRLEGLNKQYGTTIIASAHIVEHAHEHFDFRLLDLVAVKGKSQAIEIYELLAEKGRAPASREIAESYEKAFAAYLARDFNTAIALLKNHEADPPSAVLVGRCHAFLQEPPPPDWRGVYEARTK